MNAQSISSSNIPIELSKDIVFDEFDQFDTTFYQAEISLLEAHLGELLTELLSRNT